MLNSQHSLQDPCEIALFFLVFPSTLWVPCSSYPQHSLVLQIQHASAFSGSSRILFSLKCLLGLRDLDLNGEVMEWKQIDQETHKHPKLVIVIRKSSTERQEFFIQLNKGTESLHTDKHEGRVYSIHLHQEDHLADVNRSNLCSVAVFRL